MWFNETQWRGRLAAVPYGRCRYRECTLTEIGSRPYDGCSPASSGTKTVRRKYGVGVYLRAYLVNSIQLCGHVCIWYFDSLSPADGFPVEVNAIAPVLGRGRGRSREVHPTPRRWPPGVVPPSDVDKSATAERDSATCVVAGHRRRSSRATSATTAWPTGLRRWLQDATSIRRAFDGHSSACQGSLSTLHSDVSRYLQSRWPIYLFRSQRSRPHTQVGVQSWRRWSNGRSAVELQSNRSCNHRLIAFTDRSPTGTLTSECKLSREFDANCPQCDVILVDPHYPLHRVARK